MSSTGIQNYLSNVFRQEYAYDTTTTLFTPKLNLSNINTYSGNTISVFNAAIGDSNNNVYVGSESGTPYNVLQDNYFNTALGYAAASNISNTSNSVFVGYYAGVNTTNARDVITIGKSSGAAAGPSNIFLGTSTGSVGTSNVFVGHFVAPSNSSNVISIGTNSGGSSGSSNIFVGTGTGTIGSNNVFLGHSIDPSSSSASISIGTNSGGNGSSNIFVGTNTGTSGTSNIFIGNDLSSTNVSNQIRIGTGNKIPIAADTNLNWVGLGGVLAPVNTYDALDVSGNSYFLGNMGINIAPGDRTLDVNGNFRVQEGGTNLLDVTGGEVIMRDISFNSLVFGSGGLQVTDAATSNTLDFSGGVFQVKDAATSNTLDFSGGVFQVKDAATSNFVDFSGGVFRIEDVASNSLTFGDPTGSFNVIHPGSNALTFTPSMFQVSDSTGGALVFGNGITSSTGGFSSFSGTQLVLNTTGYPIATLKKGVIIISATSGSNYDSRIDIVANDSTPVTARLSSNVATFGTSITYITSNIYINNTTGSDLTFNWSVTYFPMP